MNKINIIIAFLFFIVSCNEKETTHTGSSADATNIESSAELNVEPPKVLPALQSESYPATTVDKSLLENTGNLAKKWTVVEGIRVGTITKNSSLEQIKREYPSAAYDIDTVRGKNRTLMAVTFYKNGPDQFQVFWDINNNFKNPLIVKLFNPNSKWVLSNGIRVGSSLEAVIAANGKDFYFAGFEDDTNQGKTNGKVYNWNNGNMTRLLGMAFRYDSKADAFESFRQFEKLQPFPTNHPDVKNLGLTVREISCIFR